jgi:hypothetical protein
MYFSFGVDKLEISMKGGEGWTSKYNQALIRHLSHQSPEDITPLSKS